MDNNQPLTLVYFASFAERLGRREQVIATPNRHLTVNELLQQLANQGEAEQQIFSSQKQVRVAIDGNFVPLDQVIGDGLELAIFPPFTGG